MCTPSPAQGGAARPAGERDPSAALFAGSLVQVAITLPAESQQALRGEPRVYQKARITLDGVEWPEAGIKLKGAAGSFRELDDRPGLTIKLDRFAEDAPAFCGLMRFHLNNAVQDDTLLSEWLGAQIFAAAGYTAPRVAHAHVVLDGRDLGLYVLREAFDRRFVERHFPGHKGNLYDGGFCQDVDADLEKDAGAGVDDHSDLHMLTLLCRRTRRDGDTDLLGKALDLQAMVDFTALEAMLGHWDGYTNNRNNYRLWVPTDGPAVFLPHGMDQLLGDPEASVLRTPATIAAGAVLVQPLWRQRYRQRLRELLPLFQPDRWRSRIAALMRTLAPTLEAMGGDAAARHAAAVQGLQERLALRHRNLQRQIRAPEPRPVEFRGDRPLRLDKWQPAGESEGIALKRRTAGEVTGLELVCAQDGPQVGSWRTTVLLARGRYRLQATARCSGVAPADVGGDGAPQGGVYVAVGDARSERLFGDHGWAPLACEFTVDDVQGEVELLLRLRARGGSAFWRVDSLQLVRLSQ